MLIISPSTDDKVTRIIYNYASGRSRSRVHCLSSPIFATSLFKSQYPEFRFTRVLSVYTYPDVTLLCTSHFPHRTVRSGRPERARAYFRDHLSEILVAIFVRLNYVGARLSSERQEFLHFTGKRVRESEKRVEEVSLSEIVFSIRGKYIRAHVARVGRIARHCNRPRRSDNRSMTNAREKHFVRAFAGTRGTET